MSEVINGSDGSEERVMSEVTTNGDLLPPPKDWGDDVVTVGDEGEYIVGAGHRDPADMVRACNALVGEPDDGPDAFKAEWVTHEYARLRDGLEHGWRIEWAGDDGRPVQAGDAHAFAVTVMADLR